MITCNSWLVSNAKRIKHGEKYHVDVRPFTFHRKSFHEACDFVAKDIVEKYKNIYVAFSGGMDSEYVVRCFHRNDIEFTAITAVYPGSENETERAKQLCNELGINHIIIEVDLKMLMKTFQEMCETKINGLYSILRVICSKYVYEKKGVLITGHAFLGDLHDNHNDKIIDTPAELVDHDHILEAMDTHPEHIGFFLYHPMITYSMISDMDYNMSWNEYKSFLYEISYRKKSVIQYDYATGILLKIIIRKKYVTEVQSHKMGSYSEFKSFLEKYII